MVFGTQLKGLKLHGYRRVYLTAKMQAVRDSFLSQNMLWLFIPGMFPFGAWEKLCDYAL